MTSHPKTKTKTAITPTRGEDYPEWYQQVVRAADLAETSPVRGCMVIKPWGYAIWEFMVQELDRRIKETGHQNAYFPLFVPLSHLQQEANHIDGFAKECAVVTHHRLEVNADGKLIPAGPLDEPLIVRPTSETIIGASFAQWVQSYRDLPLLINQWANVVRWEMRTRLFLRTAEILWQEGHTAHATAEEALEETMRMLDVYVEFVQNVLAIPLIRGEKTESERFPGAERTFTFEAMMQDRKALQGGTSHFLGQRFARAFQIRFRDQQGDNQYAWTTSWGVTTRLVGAMTMVHSDDNGLILPPKVAPQHVVIIPVLREETQEEVLAACDTLASALRQQHFHLGAVRVTVDRRDLGGGEKRWHWIKHGVPIILELGMRDLERQEVMLYHRLHLDQRPVSIAQRELIEGIGTRLAEFHDELYARAVAFRDRHLVEINSLEEFDAFFKEEQPKGFALAHWSGDAAVEERVRKEWNVTIRCIPLDLPEVPGTCLFSGEHSPRRVVFAKAY